MRAHCKEGVAAEDQLSLLALSPEVAPFVIGRVGWCNKGRVLPLQRSPCPITLDPESPHTYGIKSSGPGHS